MSRLLVAFMVFLFSQMVCAQYKCLGVNGATTYQDNPCPKDVAQKEVYTTPRPSSGSGMTLEQMTTNGYGELIDIIVSVSKRLADATEEETNTCVEKYRPIFKDPKSVYAVESAIFEHDGKRYVVVDVSARNGFGGATRRKIACAKPNKSN